MNRITAGAITILALILIWAASTVLIVDQRTYAIVSTWGKTQPRLIRSPGLYFKWPLPFTQVLTLDKRMQALSRPDVLRARCADQNEIGIRWNIQWRINNPLLYVKRFGNDLKHPELQLSKHADAAVRAFTAQRSTSQLMDESHQIGRAIRERAIANARTLGIDIVDARVIRLDSYVDGEGALSARMEAQYLQVADQLHSAGMLEAAQIRAAAQREREKHLAQAYRQAQILKGEGDVQAALVDADAYRQDPQFYRFYKRLEIYRKSFGARDVIIVDPSSDFSRLMPAS